MSFIFYQVFFLTSVLILILLQLSKRNVNLSFLTLFFIFFSISVFVGLRGEEVGNDTKEYYNIYYSILNANHLSYVSMHIEYLFKEMNILAHYIGGGPELVILLGTFISIFPYYFLIKRYSPSLWISLASFLSFGSFYFIHSGLRQSIACGILILAFRWLNEGRLAIFIASIIIASGFHLSALIALVLLLSRINIDWKFLTIFFAPSILVYFKPDLIHFIFEMTFSFVPEKYVKYVLIADSATRSGLGIKSLVMYLFGFCFIYAYSRTKSIAHKQIFFISVFSIGFSNLFVSYASISRLGLYFNPFICLSFSIFFSNFIRKRDKPYVGILFFLMFTFVFFRQSINDSYNIFIG